MASVNFSNAPSIDSLTMQHFRSYADQHGGLARACRFICRIVPIGEMLTAINSNGITRDLQYLTEMAEMPGRALMNIDMRYYGPSFKLPFQSSYEDINLGFICRAKGMEREFFDDWLQIINPSNTWDFNYRDDYRCNLEVFHFTDTPGQIGYASGSENGKGDGGENNAIYKATIHNAYPINVNQQPLLWQDDQFMKLVVSFTYTHWSRDGLDPERTVASGGQLVVGKPSTNPALL